jgi:hypothetical protein
MQIRWHNIFALILFVVAGVLFIANREQIVGFLMSMKNIGPGHSPGEQTVGLIAFGLTMVSLLAALRMILQSGSDR